MAILSVILLHSKPVELILVLMVVPIHELGHYFTGRVIGLQNLKFISNWLEAGVTFREDLGSKVTANQALWFYLAGAAANLLTSLIVFLTLREYSFSFVLVSAIMVAISLTPTISNNDGVHVLSIATGKLKTNKKLKLQMLLWSCIMTIINMSSLPSVFIVKALIAMFIFTYNFIINSKTIMTLYHTFIQQSNNFDAKPLLTLYLFGICSIVTYSWMFIQYNSL